MNFIGGITKLGSHDALSVMTPEVLSLVPAFFSTDTEESVRGLESLVRMFFVHSPEAADLYLMLGYNVCVPPFVRQALFSRSVDNDDMLATIRKPVLLTHSLHDAIVKIGAVDRHRAAIAHSQQDLVADAGHACFSEGATHFNQQLRVFANSLSRGSTALAHAVGENDK